MAKLGRLNPHTALPQGALATLPSMTRTHEGAQAWTMDVQTELFTLAVNNMVSEDTFYEKAKDRDARFAGLVRQAALQHPEWTAGLIGWLRSEANMRTASLVAACEYARSGAPNSRTVVDKACQRADEPGEILSYWLGTYGRPILSAVKRGVADAAIRLYNEKSYVKWDSSGSSMRFGDVIDLVHPKPKAPWQASLFRRALEDRHNRDKDLASVPGVDGYKGWIRAGAPIEQLPHAATWENVSAHHKMDAVAWEAIIPQMGYMALLRNLRNFEKAKVPAAMLSFVANKLADPEEVAKSRQLPFRFWSAYKNSGTMRFGPTLETALDLSIANIPDFPGKTLVMVDTSDSMTSRLSAKSKISCMEAGVLFGAAVAAHSAPGSGLAMYATNVAGVKPQTSLLRTIEFVMQSSGVVGHGTNTWPATKAVWDAQGPFDRIFIFTDGQSHPSTADQFVPKHVPVYTWHLGGYGNSDIQLGSGRYALAGLSDQSFKLVSILESGKNAGWPWE